MKIEDLTYNCKEDKQKIFTIIYLLNKVTMESHQYVGFTYTKINSIYGYLGIDNDKVIFIYSDDRGVVMDVMDKFYDIVDGSINITNI